MNISLFLNFGIGLNYTASSAPRCKKTAFPLHYKSPLEGSHSGLVHALGKRARGKTLREFESPPLRNKMHNQDGGSTNWSAPEITDILFNKEKGTLLIEINKNSSGITAVKEIAQTKNLAEKSEIHLTIIGSSTAKAILSFLEKSAPDARENILSKIQDLAQHTNWKLNFKPEFYYIKKEYNDTDLDNPGKIIPEIRESIIQMANVENLEEFYVQLEKIIGLELEVPLPHITLFTTSSHEEKKTRGIGIYSEKDLESLNPEQIVIN